MDLVVCHIATDVDEICPAASRRVKVDAEVTGVYERPINLPCNPLCTCPMWCAGKGAIDVAVVERQVTFLGVESRNVDDGETDQRAAQRIVRELIGDLTDHFHTVQLVAVNCGCQEGFRPRFGPRHDRQWHPNGFAEIRFADFVPVVMSTTRWDVLVAVVEGRTRHSHMSTYRSANK